VLFLFCFLFSSARVADGFVRFARPHHRHYSLAQCEFVSHAGTPAPRQGWHGCTVRHCWYRLPACLLGCGMFAGGRSTPPGPRTSTTDAPHAVVPTCLLRNRGAALLRHAARSLGFTPLPEQDRIENQKCTCYCGVWGMDR
jgi:hypothetical protein